jgi:hypothetical protein
MSKAEERAEKKYPAWRNGIGDELAKIVHIMGLSRATKKQRKTMN